MNNTKHAVYRALTDPVLFLKVPYQFFIILGFAVLILIVLTGFIILPLILAAFLYIFAVGMTKHDSRWVQILTISAKHHGIDLSKRGKRYAA